MTPRRTLIVALLAAAVPLLAGCAVGRFVVGAPSPGSAPHAQGLLVRRCGSCHDVPDPASMSPADWRAALERMHRRMRLPAAEWDSLAAMARPAPGPG